jgi:hypothetical protein
MMDSKAKTTDVEWNLDITATILYTYVEVNWTPK